MDAELDLLIRAPRAVVDGGEGPRSVGVLDGRIAAVAPIGADLAARTVVRLGEDEVLLPGLVDTHVHINEPGRTDWEGFASATRAAAAGGVTTVVDMPLNSVPPTCDAAALAAKRAAARGQTYVDVGFWGGAVPGNLGTLDELHRAGVSGFKCFLLDSGVPEFPPLDPDGLERALRETARFDGLMLAHAEDPDVIRDAPKAAGGSYARFLASRPRRAEDAAIGGLIERARRTGARVHVVHLSSADALPAIRAARAAGVRLTVETCPHYLALAAEDVPDGATEYKCCPPIREADNRERLWRALREGLIDCVVSDHSPCRPELKRLDTGDFGAAWGGIASLQLSLPVVWTGARARGFALRDVADWMARRPADLAGLRGKGRIAPGRSADFAVFAPDEAFTVDAAALHHRHGATPYAARPLTGAVRSTWLRGRRVADRHEIIGAPGGAPLTRGGA